MMHAKSQILLTVAIFHLPATLHIPAGVELSGPQCISDLHKDYAELLMHSAGMYANAVKVHLHKVN